VQVVFRCNAQNHHRRAVNRPCADCLTAVHGGREVNPIGLHEHRRAHLPGYGVVISPARLMLENCANSASEELGQLYFGMSVSGGGDRFPSADASERGVVWLDDLPSAANDCRKPDRRHGAAAAACPANGCHCEERLKKS
jgi:hypothetical protein